MPEAESVRVAVRVRPFNQREKDRNATCIIRMQGPKTVIINPDTLDEKDFAFDFSYWSHDGFDTLENKEDDLGYPGDGFFAPGNRRGGPTKSEFGSEYASQKEVYEQLGRGVLNNALDGFNCCLFAYGQTGSGKSYSFVGYGANKGVVPQVCDEVFRRKAEIEASGTTELQVTFGMMEIYNEKIRDLLNPDPKTNNDLKVRTTPKGTYVEGCKQKAVRSYKAISDTMDAGTASRTVAATQMNATSSRAHTVMTISVKQIRKEDGRVKEISSDMNLVDLAGSERAESTGATGDRLKEGAAINKSLSSLGNVISALADAANNPKKKVFIPYRDSKLTQILQSALGGNSKTIMVAALSPADINFEETLSTLRYADRAKQIKVIVQVQENPTDKLIRELKEENDKLRKMMEGMGGEGFDPMAMPTGGADAPLKGTITEEEMQAAIEKAVDEVKAASAADKAAAIEAVRQELMARSDGLSKSMITPADMAQLVRDAIESSSAKKKEKEKATADSLAQLAQVTAQREENGEDDLYSREDVAQRVTAALTAIGCSEESIAKVVAAAEMRFDQLLRDAEDGVIDEGVMKANLERMNAILDASGKKGSAAIKEAAVIQGCFGKNQGDAAAQQKDRAKQQIAQALMKNQQMMNDLTESFASKLSSSEAESVELLKSLGLSGLSPEEMKVTPSLRNLNQDPLMADALVYYLQQGDTLITTADAAEGVEGPSIVLSGGGMVAKHGTISFNRGSTDPIVFIRGNGQAFLNGQPVEADTLPLKHNDRLILGTGQAFRVVDPLDPNAKSNKQLIDWDLAQTELAEAMGTAVDLKVEEEVAKKKAELDAQLKAMEEKFARENEALKAQIQGQGASAAQAIQLKQMDRRASAMGTYKSRVKIHLAEYKRELIRLEDSLRKVMPLLNEANQIANQLGRGVEFDAALVTTVPETSGLSPIEELLTQKMTELLVRVVLSNPRTNESRDWLWDAEVFADRVGYMRTAWQDWMLKSIACPMHTTSDPFWSAPRTQHVGDAYMYLAPVAYGVPLTEWIPILNYRAEKLGELRVHITPKTKPNNDPDSLLGKKAAFTLKIEAARGLISCPNKKVRIEYTFAHENFMRKTGEGTGKKFEPRFDAVEELSLDCSSADEVAYLCKDAVCFSVHAEVDDVEEAEAVAVEMEEPPSVFECFLAYDVRLSAAAEQCAFDDDSKAHTVALDTPHTIAMTFGQENKNFRVCDVRRAYIGNIREKGTSQVLDTSWTALPIAKQSRADDLDMKPWLAQISLVSLPSCCAAGKTYEIDLKIDVMEIERIGELDDPIQVSKTLTLTAAPKGSGNSSAIDVAETIRRATLLTTKEEVYLGEFEVTDEAVNKAMMQIRDAAAHDQKDAKTIMNEHSVELEQLKHQLMDEVTRQYEVLGLRATPMGLDIGESLEMWLLPSDLLGTGGGEVPEDVEALKKLVGELRLQLQARNKELDQAKKRIAELEAGAKAAPSREPTRSAGQATPAQAAPVQAAPVPAQREQPKSSGCEVL